MKKTKLTIWLLSFAAIILLGLALLDLRKVVVENREASSLALTAEEKGREEAVVQSVKVLRQRSGEVVEEFERLTLTNEALVPTIELIESGGRSLGLAVEIASVEKSGGAGEPSKVRLVIETKGAWSGTLSFLRAVESLPHRVMIENVYFTKEGGQWRSSIAVSLYSFN